MSLSGYFDTIHGSSLYGWARNDENPTIPITVEAVTSDGRVVGTAVANQFRSDLLVAGKGDGRCSFKLDLHGGIVDLLGAKIAVRSAGEHTDFLAGSPKLVTVNLNYKHMLAREQRVRKMLPRLRRRLNQVAGKHSISIIMPVYNTPQKWFIEALESVRNQWCDNWELICVDDGSTAAHIRRILDVYCHAERRIRVIRSAENVGIAASTNLGLRAARSDYVAFMDHDDFLEPHAVWRLIRAIQKTDADLLYSDEVVTSESITHVLDVRARPAFSYDYYLSHPYLVHLLCVRRTLAHRIGGWDESMRISGDVDFVLRMIEVSRKVAHIPAILYRWRTHDGSAGHAAKKKVTTATVAAIQRHLDRLNTKATAKPGAAFNQFRVSWPAPFGKTLIVIPTKNGVDMLRKCVRSIERTCDPAKYRLVVIDHQSTDPRTIRYLRFLRRRHTVMPYEGSFNFSRMNNVAVDRYSEGCRFVLCMNNDVQAVRKGWLEHMTALAARPEVGAVGPKLLFSDRRIQHAGVIIGFSNAAEHVGKFMPFTDSKNCETLGANCTLTSVRDFSAVTAACVLMRRSVYRQVAGFTEEFAVAFNDTDLCLRILKRGYRVLYDGAVWLYHHESATRTHTNDLVHPEDTLLFQRTWKHLMNGADPYYNPYFSLDVQDHVLREDRVATVVEPRLVEINKSSRLRTRPMPKATVPATVVQLRPTYRYPNFEVIEQCA